MFNIVAEMLHVTKLNKVQRFRNKKAKTNETRNRKKTRTTTNIKLNRNKSSCMRIFTG